MKQYKGTIIFVSHDRKFTEIVSTRIVDIHNRALTVFDGTYEQYKTAILLKNTTCGKMNYSCWKQRFRKSLVVLSVSPTDELEKGFQRLLSEKRKLQE
ncbi:hypothetical protein CSV80_06760 [Sporosarcina sp. P12(2017)]|nr:hypothetical protein CSV81_06905 [Sporosarcina sp. P10]PIC61382.1 hypothetical protein CSV80_06760 [Sporosarcina sp. P12(2017)]